MKNALFSTPLFIITLFVLCVTGGKVYAQKVNRDSLKREAFSRDSILQDSIADKARTISIGKMDGRRLRLSPLQREQFNAGNKNPNSDLFKPTRATVSDTTFLFDSLYVKTYRMAAYKRAFAYRKRTAGHYILMGGIVLVSIPVAAGVVILGLLAVGAIKIQI